jgi:hypothetical protein
VPLKIVPDGYFSLKRREIVFTQATPNIQRYGGPIAGSGHVTD